VSSTRHSSLRRLLALLWLAVFAAAGLLDVHHRATVVHVVCPEDGGLAHASLPGHGHGERVHGLAEEAAAGPALAATPGEPNGHAEHCGLPELGKASELDVASPAVPPPPRGEAPRARLAAGAPAHASVSRLSLAPKQSPPRAG